MTRPLYRISLDMVTAWWRVDRVRISPREGELLRLRPGGVLTVDDVPAEVRARMVVHEIDRQRVSYECQTEAGPATLEVDCPDGQRQWEVVWSQSGRKESLFDHQFDVFG